MGKARGNGKGEAKILARGTHKLFSEQMVRSLNLKLTNIKSLMILSRG